MKSLLRVPLFFCVLSIISGTALAQLPAPVTVSPSGTVSDTTPVYTWNAVANATDYQLWIDGASGNVLKQWYPATSVCTGSSCKIEPQLPLVEGPYTWWVQPRAGSTPGLWSAGIQFRVTQQGAPPVGATLLSPSGLIPERTPTFRWPALATATSYQLWLDGPSGKLFAQWYEAAAVCSGSSCSVKPALSLADATHKWWIQTRNGAGDGPWSSPLEFQVSTFTAPPPAPQVVSPAGVTRDLQPTYSWNVAGDALDYYLWIDGPSGNRYKQWIPASSICSGNTCSARPQLTLSEGAHKFWVQGRNGKGSGPWSLEKNFTVVTLVPPAQPIIQSPEGVLYRDLPTYSWKPVTDTDEYYLWINGPSGNVFKQWYPVTGTLCSSTTCSIKPPLPLNNGPHVWWVQSTNSAGDGPWSAGKNFTVVKPTALPALVVLLSPSGVIADSSPVYSWKAIAQSDEYQFWLDGPSGNLLQPWVSASSVCSGVTCSFKPALTLSEGAHTFKVRAKNGLGLGDFSPTMSFRYSPLAALPGAATLVSPKGTITSSLPTYTWNKLASSTEYYLWINGPSGNIFKKWYPSTASLCPGSTCSVKPDLTLERGSYTWWIQTKNSAGDGPWSQAVSLTVQTSDTTAPTVSLSAPAPGAVVSGTLSVSATASDNVGVTGVQFLLDGQNLGAEDVSAPFTVSWNTTSASNGSHTLSARVRDAAGNQATSGAVSVTVQNKDTTPPAVSIASPISGSTVSGTISVSANASDNVGVAGVQFRVDGQNLGAEDTQSPFSVPWNTASVAEGSHTITALARDAAGNPTSSAPISVTVSRVVIPGGAGWAPLPNTKLRSVCPPNGFGGSGYEFSAYCWTVTAAWNSAVFDTRRNRLIIWGGGHGDYYGNELYALDVASSTMSRLTDPGLPFGGPSCPEAIAGGTQPNSRHTYDAIAYMENVDRMFVFGGSLTSCGGFSRGTWTFNFGNSTWERRNPSGTIPGVVPGIVTAYDPTTGYVYLHDDQYLYRYDLSTDSYQRLSGSNAIDYHMTAVIDPVRKKFVIVGSGRVYVYDISSGSNFARQTLTTTGGDAIVNSFYPGLAYRPPSGKVVAWNGGDSVYSLDVGTATWTVTSPPGGPGPALGNGTFERWSYSATSNAFVVVNSVDNDAYRFTFVSGDTTGPTVSLTSPTAGSVVAATVSVSASAGDNVGVAGVQFKVDGANLGAEDTTAPYSVSWDTASASDGAHQVTAVARDAAGNQTTASISVTVNNGGGTQPGPVENTVTIYSTSGVSQINRPVSIARSFRQGGIPQFVAASIGSTSLLTQTDVKNRWPDGSLKFAIVSFVIPSLPPGGSVIVKFGNQASGNNSGYLAQSQMLDSRFDFDGRIEMTGAATRSVSARQMLSAGNFRYWLQGPIVTAVILEDRTPSRTFDQDFGDGSKALHPIFEAWFYDQSSKVETGYTIENTWASSDATKGMRDLAYSLTIRSGLASPSTEFTQPTFTHISRSRWHKRFWLGTDPPAIRIDHNIRYFVSTQAIPHYDTSLQVSSALLSSQHAAWTAADKTLDGNSTGIGNFKKALGMAGANDWIGLMSTWDVLYLLTMDDRMLETSLGNADLAGRLPWHYREADTRAGTGDYFDGVSVETQARVVSVNARKTETLADLSVSCGAQYAADEIVTGTASLDGWDIQRDHMPDLAYVPYLTTGRYYYLEELQYQAAFIIGHRTGCYSELYNRQGEAGYLIDSQLRGDAWGFRTMAYAAFVSPDATPEKAYFEDKLKNNLALWEGERNLSLTYAAKQSQWTWANTYRRDPSPLGVWKDRGAGFIQDPLRSDGYLLSAASPWEENFLLCALGMARQFGYSTDTLLRYMARLRFHNLLDPNSSKYLIEQYRIPTRLSSTGDWIQTWPEYTNAYSPIPTGWKTESTADHGYGFIALAAVSFLHPYTVDGYTGQQAWTVFKTQKPGQDRFATESPKWAIVP